MRIGQFLPMTVQGRACRSPGNSGGVIQVEIGGKAALPFTHYPELVEPVRALFQTVRSNFPSIPNRALTFYDDNGAYGESARSRVASSAWYSTAGLVG